MIVNFGDSTDDALSPSEQAAIRRRAGAQFQASMSTPQLTPLQAMQLALNPVNAAAIVTEGPAQKFLGAVKKTAGKVVDAVTAVATPVAKAVAPANSANVARWLAYGALAMGGIFAVKQMGLLGGGGRRSYRHIVENPPRKKRRRKSKKRKELMVRNGRAIESHRDPDIDKAVKFRKAFAWGYPARKIKKVKVYPRPRVMTALGDVVAVRYRTRKKGERARIFHHDFEGKLPRLGMDVKNRRLHMYGGTYTVTPDGITG